MSNIKLQEGITEVLDILSHMDNIYVDKIPKNFMSYLEENKLDDYKIEIDYSKPLEENELKEKTKTLLAIIYMDYWCNEEEKKEFIKILDKNQKIKDEKTREKYNPDNLFKKKQITEEKDIEEKIDTIEMKKYNESILKKVWKKILTFFNK